MNRLLRALCLGIMVGVLGLLLALTPPGRFLEERFGLYWLFWLRGPITPPEEAIIVSLDNRSARRLGLPDDPRRAVLHHEDAEAVAGGGLLDLVAECLASALKRGGAVAAGVHAQ